MKKVTQAFVLAAGLGTRLRPLTEELPKPLVPIFQKPLITFALDHLLDAGVESFVINTHRLPGLFERLFPERSYADRPLRLVHEPVLLETGGGIKNVEPELGTKPFIVYSGDILTDAEIGPLIDEHFRSRNDVTLGLRRLTGLGAQVAMHANRVISISKDSNPDENFDYANISVWNAEIFRRIPPNRKISFIPILIDWIGQDGKIGGLELSDGRWFNIGSREEYLDVHRTIAAERWSPRYVRTPDWANPVAKSAHADPSVELRGCSVVGADCEVGADVILEDTILWPGSQIASRSELRGCIVRCGRKAEGIHSNQDI
jgi:mannose-1-phosphate guanylyltransferase